MLAKEIKIKTLKQQREFIEKKLSTVDGREDGDTSYRYVGVIYPEVIRHFETEGFTVTKVENELLTALTKGNSVYVFSVKDDLTLTEEELKQAEAYEIKKDDEDIGKGMDDFLEMLLSGRHPF